MATALEWASLEERKALEKEKSKKRMEEEIKTRRVAEEQGKKVEELLRDIEKRHVVEKEKSHCKKWKRNLCQKTKDWSCRTWDFAPIVAQKSYLRQGLCVNLYCTSYYLNQEDCGSKLVQRGPEENARRWTVDAFQKEPYRKVETQLLTQAPEDEVKTFSEH